MTDHKPLVTIFGPKSGIPKLPAATKQRWALILQAYQCDIEYRIPAIIVMWMHCPDHL